MFFKDLRRARTTICRSPSSCPIFLARLQGLLRRSAWLRVESIARTDDAKHQKSAVRKRARRLADAAVPEEQAGVLIRWKNHRFRHSGAANRRQTIQLTLMEAKLLRHLIQSQGRTVTRKSILEDVWGLREDTDTRAIDNFIVRLRRYIEEDPSKPSHLLTVRGLGYRFVA